MKSSGETQTWHDKVEYCPKCGSPHSHGLQEICDEYEIDVPYKRCRRCRTVFTLTTIYEHNKILRTGLNRP